MKSFKLEGYYVEKRKWLCFPLLSKWYVMKEVSITDADDNIKITRHIVDSYWNVVKACYRLHELKDNMIKR